MALGITSATPCLVGGVFSFNLASVAANTKARQTFTVAGLRPDMIVHCQPETDMTTGLDIVGSYCAANDTLTLVLWNSTGSPIDMAAANFMVRA